MEINLKIGPSQKRLDLALKEALEQEGWTVSRSDVTRAFSEGRVLDAHGQTPKPSLKLDQEITLTYLRKEVEVSPHEAEQIPLEIVYEDEAVLVINKAVGMVVHPAPGHRGGTLVNALLHHCGTKLSSINGHFRPGIVHRIDKDTSGLLLVAKTDEAHRRLAADLAKHEIEREYMAIVYGRFAEETGRIEAPIGRDPQHRQRMKVIADGKPAITHFRVVENLDGCTLLRLRLETGRTHQIRVHMQYINHPVVGDPLYAVGRKKMGIQGQLLHADTLRFRHPVSGENMELHAGWPEHFERFLVSHR